jgi:tetratricopeptide (TPR) repeat protein
MTRVQALDVAGNLVGFLGDYSQAAAFSDEELELARESGDLSLIGTALSNAGAVFQRLGKYERAEELYAEAHRVVQGLTDPVLVALPHLFLGDTILAQGQYDRAKPLYDEVLAMFQATGFDWGLIEAHAGLGGATYCAGNLVDATAHYAESLERAWDLSLDQFMVSSLLGLAGIAAEFGSPEQGARLFGAAEGVGARLEAPIFPRDHPVRARARAALTQVLGERRLAAARESGRALTLDQAVAEAKTVAEMITGLPD